jgi:hypothetical protein
MLYEKSGAAGGDAGAEGGPAPEQPKKNDDDVIEGEFEVKK